ncbi:MAG TPA: hypothetical protein VGD98_07455 [Ktedonobacteraceae bacterium]
MDDTSLAKEQVWDRIVQRFSQVTDGLGKPLDPGIFTTVVAFNAVGMITTASCEGHLKRGVPAPFLLFNSDALTADYKRARDAMAQARKERQAQQLSTVEVERMYEEGKQLQAEVRRKHLQSFAPLMGYLSAFMPNAMFLTIDGSF